MINIAEPRISEADIMAVVKAMKSNSVSTYGNEVNEFENRLHDQTGLSAVALNSGTSALEVSIDCLINELSRNKKYKIGFSDYTFIATANSILNTANTPLPLPCDNQDFIADLSYLEMLLNKPQNIDILILTLPFGNFSNKIEQIIDLCNSKNLPIILDAAASIGLDFKRINDALSKCNSVCLSFNGNKVITSGAGGAILSSDKVFLERARSLLSLNRIANYDHIAPGQNKKMPALNAALGLSQLNQLSEKMKYREYIYSIYADFAQKVNSKGMDLFPSKQYSCLSNWLYFLKPICKKVKIKKIRSIMHENGFNTPPFWKPVSQQKLYKNYVCIGNSFPEISYPDLLQVPITLDEPEKTIERIMTLIGRM